MSSRCRVTSVACLVFAATAAPAGAAVTSDPPLRPPFRPDVENYVVACDTRSPTTFRVTAGDRVRTRAETLAPGQGTAIDVPGPGGARRYHVRCLPRDFPAWTSEVSGEAQSQWFLVTPAFRLGEGRQPRYVAVFDRHGTPVWWRRAGVRPGDARLTPDGNLEWARIFGVGYGTSRFGAYEERRFDGSLVGNYAVAGAATDFHDTERTLNGGRLMLSYRQRAGVDLSRWGGPANAAVVDAEIQEVDSAGNLIWLWNSAGHISLAEAARWLPEVVAQPVKLANGRKLVDIAHVNSVTADGDGVIVSMRHTDSVYRIDKATGKIDWKLGGTATPESLRTSDGAGGFGGQHDARVLPDGTLTLFDNGTGLARPPRAVRYRIDAGKRAATLLDTVREPSLTGSSPCCGNARRVAGGNWVVAWGGPNLVSEATAAGRPVLRLRFGSGIFTYRVFPVEPGRLSAGTLRAGMDAMHPR